LGLIAIAARLAARACERSPRLARAVRSVRFAGRARIVAEIRRLSGPREVVATCAGVRYRLDLEDDVQRSIYFGVYDEGDLEAVLPLIPPGATCVDVGANVGFYALQFARRAGPGGSVHAFEPDPRNAERLRANCALNPFGTAVRTVEAAVSNREGRALLFQSAEEHSGWGSLARFGDISAGSVEVECQTLDGYLERHGIERVDFMKVDVEAGEFEVLEGASRSLRERRIGRILIEWNGIRLAERGRTFEEFLDAFARAGYRPVRLRLGLLERMRRGSVRPEGLWTNFLFEPDSPIESSSSRGS
jgi:FkbM family methyltransferase